MQIEASGKISSSPNRESNKVTRLSAEVLTLSSYRGRKVKDSLPQCPWLPVAKIEV